MPRSASNSRRVEMLPWLLLFGAISMLVLTVVVGRLYLQHRLEVANQSAEAARQATQDLTKRLRSVEGEKAALEERLLRVEQPPALTTPLPEGQSARLSSAQEELGMRFRDELRAGKVETQRGLSELRIVFPGASLFEDAKRERLSRSGEELLARLAPVLVRGRDKRVQVSAHTASVTGWDQSAARAARVARFLAEKGQLPPAFLSASGHVGQAAVGTGSKGLSSSPERVELIVTEGVWGDAAPVEPPAAVAAPSRSARSRKAAKKSKAASGRLVPAKSTAAR